MAPYESSHLEKTSSQDGIYSIDLVHTYSGAPQNAGSGHDVVRPKRSLSQKLSNQLPYFFIDVIRLAEHYEKLDDVDECLLDYNQIVQDGLVKKKEPGKDDLLPKKKAEIPVVQVPPRQTETCYSWLVVACGFLLHGISIGLINSFSPMLTLLMHTYHTTESVTSIIGATQKAVFYLSGKT